MFTMQGILFLVSLLFGNVYCHLATVETPPLKKDYASRYKFFDYYGGFTAKGISANGPLGHGLHVTTVELNGRAGAYEPKVDALIHYKLYGAASELEQHLFEDLVFYVKIAESHDKKNRTTICEKPSLTLKVVKCKVDEQGKTTIDKVVLQFTQDFQYGGRRDSVIVVFRKLFNAMKIPLDEVYVQVTTKNECYFKLGIELLEPDSINP